MKSKRRTKGIRTQVWILAVALLAALASFGVGCKSDAQTDVAHTYRITGIRHDYVGEDQNWSRYRSLDDLTSSSEEFQKVGELYFPDYTPELSPPYDEPISQDVSYYSALACMIDALGEVEITEDEIVFHGDWNARFPLEKEGDGTLSFQPDLQGSPFKEVRGRITPVQTEDEYGKAGVEFTLALSYIDHFYYVDNAIGAVLRYTYFEREEDYAPYAYTTNGKVYLAGTFNPLGSNTQTKEITTRPSGATDFIFRPAVHAVYLLEVPQTASIETECTPIARNGNRYAYELSGGGEYAFRIRNTPKESYSLEVSLSAELCIALCSEFTLLPNEAGVLFYNNPEPTGFYKLKYDAALSELKIYDYDLVNQTAHDFHVAIDAVAAQNGTEYPTGAYMMIAVNRTESEQTLSAPAATSDEFPEVKNGDALTLGTTPKVYCFVAEEEGTYRIGLPYCEAQKGTTVSLTSYKLRFEDFSTGSHGVSRSVNLSANGDPSVLECTIHMNRGDRLYVMGAVATSVGLPTADKSPLFEQKEVQISIVKIG